MKDCILQIYSGMHFSQYLMPQPTLSDITDGVFFRPVSEKEMQEEGPASHGRSCTVLT